MIIHRFLTNPVILPIKNADPLEFEQFSTSSGDLLLGFSHELSMAEFFENHQDYLTVDAAEVIAICQANQLALGFDFSQNDAEIFTLEQLEYFQKFLNSQSDISDVLPSNLSPAPQDHKVLEELQNRLAPHEELCFGLSLDHKQQALLIIASAEALSGVILHEIWSNIAQLESTKLIQLLPVLTTDPRWPEFSEKFTKIEPIAIEAVKTRPPILRF